MQTKGCLKMDHFMGKVIWPCYGLVILLLLTDGTFIWPVNDIGLNKEQNTNGQDCWAIIDGVVEIKN